MLQAQTYPSGGATAANFVNTVLHCTMHINVTMCPLIRQHYSLAWTLCVTLLQKGT
jgi:hypothetical protein